MTQWPESLILVGAGKMGGAMARGWLDGGLAPSSLTLIDPQPSEEIAALAAERGVAVNPAHPEPPAAIALAVKPQALDAVAPSLARLVGGRTLIISILAGKRIADIKARLPGARAVVRVMPNTPAAIGRGVSAASLILKRRWSNAVGAKTSCVLWELFIGSKAKTRSTLSPRFRQRAGLCVRAG